MLRWGFERQFVEAQFPNWRNIVELIILCIYPPFQPIGVLCIEMLNDCANVKPFYPCAFILDFPAFVMRYIQFIIDMFEMLSSIWKQ